MSDITIKSTSATSAEVAEDFELNQTSTTRRVLRATIVSHPGSNEALLKIRIIHQKKRAGDTWEPITDRTLQTLKSGEGVSLNLDTEQTGRLIEALRKLRVVAKKRGLSWGTRELVVGERGRMFEAIDEQSAEIIRALIEKNHQAGFWTALVDAKPAVATQYAYERVQSERVRALGEFRAHLSDISWKEPNWEDFLDANQWILGLGVSYRVLGKLRRQANYGGATFLRKGEQKGEFLTATKGHHRFTGLVEIKRPDTLILNPKKGEYRNSVPTFSGEFVQALSQVQVNARTWDKEGSQREGDREVLRELKAYTIAPRGILIIGHLQELDTQVKRNAFELFRSNLHNPAILTFDELYARAEAIITDQIA